jgi:cytochrome c biogenesis protein CcmG, thiol:disulfide interchange protein DsbE
MTPACVTSHRFVFMNTWPCPASWYKSPGVEVKDVAAGTPSAEQVPRRRRLLVIALQATAIALVVGLLGLLVWRIVVRDNGSQFAAAVADGKRPEAPGFTLPVISQQTILWPRALAPALADGEVSLDELRGYPVVLNFWASWCVPCRDEAPALAAAARAYAGRVVFLGLDHQDLTSDARGFLEKSEVPYVSVRDGSDGTYRDYGLTGTPETYYLDARGRAVAHSPGAVERDSLEQGIRAALHR